MKLPLAVPVIASYPRHAYCLAAAGETEAYLPWIYSHYIQLRCRTEGTLAGDWFDYVVPDPLTFPNPLFRHQFHTVSRALLDSAGMTGSGYAASCVEAGYYVILHVNERFLSCSHAYGRYNLPHAVLVYGHDPENGSFETAGFFRDGKLTLSQVGAEELTEAYMRAGSMADGSDGGDAYGDLGYMSAVHTFRLNPAAAYAYDPPYVAAQMRDYAESRNTVLDARYLEPDAGCAYGLDVCNRLASLLQRNVLENGESAFDHRPFQIVLEHKTVMVRRLSHMERYGVCAGNRELLEAYGRFESEARAIRNRMLKFMLKEERDEELVRSIAAGLIDLRDKEEVALARWLARNPA